MASAIAGPSTSKDTADTGSGNKEWKLPKEHELRIEVEGNEKVSYCCSLFALK